MLPFAAFAIVLMTDAYKRVIVEGTGAVWAAVVTLIAAALVISGISAQGQLESIRREP
jgi:multisubunit Na+/H+ antiporter MnhG subunit